MIWRYNNYFNHWKDYYVLLGVLCTMDILMQARLWEGTFDGRYLYWIPENQLNEDQRKLLADMNMMTKICTLISFIISGLSIAALICKETMATLW